MDEPLIRPVQLWDEPCPARGCQLMSGHGGEHRLAELTKAERRNDPTMVAESPTGWNALCLDCSDNGSGGALYLNPDDGQTKEQAEDAATLHFRSEHHDRIHQHRCPTCGHPH